MKPICTIDNWVEIEKIQKKYSQKITEFGLAKGGLNLEIQPLDQIFNETKPSNNSFYVIIQDILLEKRGKFLVKLKKNSEEELGIEIFSKDLETKQNWTIKEIQKLIESFFGSENREFKFSKVSLV